MTVGFSGTFIFNNLNTRDKQKIVSSIHITPVYELSYFQDAA
jgi:hypothetical protein